MMIRFRRTAHAACPTTTLLDVMVENRADDPLADDPRVEEFLNEEEAM